MCHDYPPEARGRRKVCTVKDQKAHNIRYININKGRVYSGIRTATAIKPWRFQRSSLPSIQVNIRAGEFPEVESNGVHYLKIVKSHLEYFTLLLDQTKSRVTYTTSLTKQILLHGTTETILLACQSLTVAVCVRNLWWQSSVHAVMIHL